MDRLESKMAETIENSNLLIWHSKKLISLSWTIREELIRAEDAVWRTRQEVKKTITKSKNQSELMGFRSMSNIIP